MAASGLCCGTWYLHCVIQDLSVAAHASPVSAHGLSCFACGILVPQPVIERVSPALPGGFLTTGPPGKPLRLDFLKE